MVAILALQAPKVTVLKDIWAMTVGTINRLATGTFSEWIAALYTVMLYVKLASGLKTIGALGRVTWQFTTVTEKVS